jgi:hypothetical protein
MDVDVVVVSRPWSRGRSYEDVLLWYGPRREATKGVEEGVETGVRQGLSEGNNFYGTQ